MVCIACGYPLAFLSEKRNRKTAETEEIQLICKQCGHYSVILNGKCTWYDKNDKPIHPTHDR